MPLPDAASLVVGGVRLPLDLLGDIVDQPLFRGQYEEAEMRVARRLIPPGGTVVDVGANQGLYSALALAAGASRVIAVEPHPGLAAALRALSPMLDVRQCAVSDSVGYATLSIFRDSLYMSTIRQHGVEGCDAVDVDVSTLDVLLHEIDHVDLMKIDVENLEVAVLAGGAELFSRGVVRHALVEVYVGHSAIADLLDEWGYQSQLIERRGHLVRRPALGPDARSGIGGNYLVSPISSAKASRSRL